MLVSRMHGLPDALYPQCNALTSETSRSQNMEKRSKTILILLISIYLCIHCVYSESDEKTKELNAKCNKKSNGTCGPCVGIKGCSYCEPTKKCTASDLVKDTLHGSCPDNQWKVAQCVFTGKILIIVLPSVAGVILIALCCCIYCCCCRKKKKGSKKEDKDDAKYRRKREEIDMKHAQRRAERQVKYDEIRKKYGLYKNGEDGEDGRYHQFSNEA